MRTTVPLSLALTALIVVFVGARPTGQSCQLQSPPAAFGERGYAGQSGYMFDYFADAGNDANRHYFQLMVKNAGTTPLTFDWEHAQFFRRGVPTGTEARSQCRVDGNAPNVAHGLIKYGPNTQFTGPDARFYDYQQTTAHAMIYRAPQAPGPVNFGVKWVAQLDSGQRYVVDFTVATAREGDSLEYTFKNFGAAVQIDWPMVLSSSVLERARLQNRSQPVVSNNRLALPTGTVAVPFKVALKGEVQRVSSPLSVFTPEGVLLYRDVFTGLQLGDR